MMEKRSLLQSGVPTIQIFSTWERTEMLQQLGIEVGERVVRDFLCYLPKMNDE